MPATHGGSTPTSVGASSGTSWAHTNTSGTVLYMVVAGWDGTGRTVTATYNSVAMTQIADSGLSHVQDRCWLFRLVNPATGSNSAAFSISGGVMHVIAAAVSVNGAHTTSFSTPVTGVSAALDATFALNVTGTSGGLIVDGFTTGAGVTHTVNGPATHVERWDATVSGQSGGGGTSDGSTSSQSVGWTPSASVSWAMAAVNVQSSDAGASPQLPRTRPFPYKPSGQWVRWQ